MTSPSSIDKPSAAHTVPATLSVIVPATNRPETLARCLAAIEHAAAGPEQVIVVEDSSIRHPAFARNAGARDATGDVLVFVDADVTVHSDAFLRIRAAFEADPDLVALFGSYDDAPAALGSVSVFRNLLHHHVHQAGAGPASTFWAGLGAMRRDAFEALDGFAQHPTEDIELGIRLSKAGKRIVLDPRLQGTHLKDWSIYSMVRTDLFVRGIPWVGLLLENRGSASVSTLNLGWRHRLSALACVALLAAVALWSIWIALAALVLLVALNFSFYRLLARRQGFPRVIGGVALHVLHHLVSVAAVLLGVVAHVSRRRTAQRPAQGA